MDMAYQAAKQFTEIYYATLDLNRYWMFALYDNWAILNWNGHVIQGSEVIQQLFLALPASEHLVDTLEVQLILDPATNYQLKVLIQVDGIVKYFGKIPQPFKHSFVITFQETNWKIVKEYFQYYNPQITPSFV